MTEALGAEKDEWTPFAARLPPVVLTAARSSPRSASWSYACRRTVRAGSRLSCLSAIRAAEDAGGGAGRDVRSGRLDAEGHVFPLRSAKIHARGSRRCRPRMIKLVSLQGSATAGPQRLSIRSSMASSIARMPPAGPADADRDQPACCGSGRPRARNAPPGSNTGRLVEPLADELCQPLVEPVLIALIADGW